LRDGATGVYQRGITRITGLTVATDRSSTAVGLLIKDKCRKMASMEKFLKVVCELC
jgi:hypothetical protein